MPACPALKRATERLLDDPDAETADGTIRLHIADEPGAQLPFLQPTDRPGFLGKIGPYEVRRLIGSGGSGMVFEGYDPVLKRTVAVKVLSPLLAVSDQARSRFLREAQAAAALTHEHLVTIHAVEEADGVLYLVLEYVPGESLADRLRREGRLPLATVIRIGAQVARGLAAAHEKGLVHRDIKPGNLLLEAGTDRVKVADFGLAKSADEVSLTIEGMIAGTPDFMSPEQASGAGVDARSDLFSLGAVLYTACTGSPPFRGESPLCTLERVRWEAPAPLC
ncbi:MAG TPA: serine/threonine-protein kinase, partial [Fimbriiglobus sp.]|nr:serine/threonine-protein kinase [Fimbriiglobus sp.]